MRNKQRLIFQKIKKKHTHKTQVSKVISSITRLFVSMDINYNNSQNTKVQK